MNLQEWCKEILPVVQAADDMFPLNVKELPEGEPTRTDRMHALWAAVADAKNALWRAVRDAREDGWLDG